MGKKKAIPIRAMDLRYVRAKDLIPHPQNWRTHPERQRSALRRLLEKLGYVNVLLAREEGNKLYLIDGHLRRDTTPNQEVPVVVVDVTEEEAKLMLATQDPLAAWAGIDTDRLGPLLDEVQTDQKDIDDLLADLNRRAQVDSSFLDRYTEGEDETTGEDPRPPSLASDLVKVFFIIPAHRRLALMERLNAIKEEKGLATAAEALLEVVNGA